MKRVLSGTTAIIGAMVFTAVTVAGQSVGGKSEDDLVPVLEDISAQVADTTVELQLPQTSLTSTATRARRTTVMPRIVSSRRDLSRYLGAPFYRWGYGVPSVRKPSGLQRRGALAR